MNTLAVAIGLAFGVLSAVLCYGISMITSGLFSRPFYRHYSRILIGICCVMLLAPALRWLASSSPMMGSIGLSIAQYIAMAILGYGVYRYNRDYIGRVFLRRKTTAYFIFGTLAYATIVTLVFLHVAVRGTPSWAGQGHGYITAAHYGPLLVLLAAMVFDTDARLKAATRDPRRFSRFTFVGYAISFLGVFVSAVPYVADAFGRLGSAAVAMPWLQSLSSAEALLIAILLYGWLVWKYESIPPLFMLLAAIIAEYHVLVTQWLFRAYGPETWGLASLPLFAGIAFLEHYFSRWDQQKQSARERQGGIDQEAIGGLRFATPFRVVHWGLVAALFAITFWNDLRPGDVSPLWLGVTFFCYSGFFLLMSFTKQQPLLIYLCGVLAGLAAMFGLGPVASPVSTAALSGLAVLAGSAAYIGERRGLKLCWRTPLADVSIVFVVIVIGAVASRHVHRIGAYDFHAVGIVDALALAGAMLTCVVGALLYRSRLPVFGMMLAAVTVIPIWSAGLGLLASLGATLIEAWLPKSRHWREEEPVRLLNRFGLPMQDKLPSLFSWPLSLGGIPLSLAGLAISAFHVLEGDFSASALLGAAISALALLLLTRSYREPWLYIVGILATYFAVHALAHGRLLVTWPDELAVSAHMTIMASLSLFGFIVASVYAWWCHAVLQRCAEDREAAVRVNRRYYSGLLFHVTTLTALIPFLLTWVQWVDSNSPVWTLSAASLVAVLFGLAASVYRSQLLSYLSLISLTLAVFCGFEWLGLPNVPQSTVLAGLSFLAAILSWFSYKRASQEDAAELSERSWIPALPLLPETGLGLWLQPLALYALVCSPISVLSVMQGDSTWSLSNIWTRPAPFTYALASVTLLLSTRAFRVSAIYAVSIAFAYAACHAAAQLGLNRGSVETDPVGIHLLVASVVSLASCLIATALTWQVNRRIASVGLERREPLEAVREFYAGTLHHMALLAALGSFIGLSGVALFHPDQFVGIGPIHVIAAAVLTITFFVSGICYLSRLHTYGMLASLLLVMLGAVAMLTGPAERIAYQASAAAVMGLGFGLLAWWLGKPTLASSSSPGKELEASMRWRLNTCWEHPPLPLVSRDRNLWATPLAHISVGLPAVALGAGLMQWSSAPVLLVVLPIYCASCTWLLASLTFGFGMFVGVDRHSRATDDSADGPTSEQFSQQLLYAMSVLAFASAVHVTIQLSVLQGLPIRAALAWQLLTGADLLLIGWGVATVIASRWTIGVDEGTEVTSSRKLCGIYAGVLHHLVFTAGGVTLLLCATFGLVKMPLALPLVATCGLLVLFFALAGATYRSQIGSYLSLVALGLMVVQLMGLLSQQVEAIVAILAASCSSLGLALITVAAIMTRMGTFPPRSVPGRRLFATAWATPPLPLRAASWSSLWFNPLRQASLCFVLVGFALFVANVSSRVAWDVWSTSALVCLATAALACAVAAKLYDNSILTYVATAIVAIGVFPLLSVYDEDDSRLGYAWSLIALAFWFVGYGIERLGGVAASSGTEGAAELPLTRIYERPLIRSSAVLAILGICQGLFAWSVMPANASLVPLLLTSAAATAALLLNARSMNVLHRFARGRVLVYLACVAITGCCLIVTATRWGVQSLGPNAAVTALILSCIGLILLEWVRRQGAEKPNAAARKLTFAEPLSRYGAGLAMLAALMSLVIANVAGGMEGGQPLVTSIAGWLGSLATRPLAFTFTIAALVSVLTVRATRMTVWLDIAVVLGSSGLLLLANDLMNWSTGTLTLATLVTMNVLVGVARLVRAGSVRFESLLGLTQASTDRSFFRWPLLVATVCLMLQAVYLLLILTEGVAIDLSWAWMLNGLLCAFLFFHVMYLQPHPWLLHLLVGSTVIGFFGSCRARGWDVTPDVALAVMGFVWGLVAIQFNRPLGTRVLSMLHLPLSEEEEDASALALVYWSVGMIGLAVILTFPVYWIARPEFANLSVSLLFASLTCLLVGVRWRNVLSTVASAILFPLCLAATAVLYADPTLLGNYLGLAIAGLSFGYVVGEFGVRKVASSSLEADPYRADISKSLIILAHLFATLAVAVTTVSMFGLHPSPVFAIAMAVVALSWLWMAWESGREIPVYLSMAAVFAAILYLCTALLDLTLTRSTIAAFAVIGYSFVLYGLNILVSRAQNPRADVFVNPTYYMALASPLALALVTPLDQKGAGAFTMLAAGAFYLIVSERKHTRWTIYVAAAFFNVAIYLWIPEAREFTGLAQLYVIPAAVTVLIFAQLHREDLKPRALSGIRAAAAGAVLAVSTLEVFFVENSGLVEFVAVLILSLLGIAAGVSLRIRPFVSIGIAFLVINVVGQLGLQFHREGGIIRAVILIGIGIVVLAAMVFFNIHRERILRRYRGFLADENWE